MDMKRQLIIIIGLALLVIVVVRFMMARGQPPEGQFTREMKHVVIEQHQRIRLKSKTLRIAGITNSRLFVTSMRAENLMDVNYLTGSVAEYALPDSTMLKNVGGDFHTRIDSPFIYLFSPNEKTIYTGTLSTKKMVPHRLPFMYTRAVPISPDLCVVRAYSNDVEDQLFYSVRLSTLDIKKEMNISTLFGDGGLQTDGMLFYDRESGSCIYPYYKMNSIFVFDTNLQSGKVAFTIDSLTKPSITSAFTEEKGIHKQITTKGPKLILHQLGALYNGSFFVVSTIMAANQVQSVFDDNFTIDVYDVATLVYRFSFYIPKSDRHIRDFAVTDGGVLVLYEDYIESFSTNDLLNGLSATSLIF